MDVYLASSAKRFNSTMQPAITTNKRSCVLKHPCSVINPDIELDRTGTDESYNYAYIPDFGRYYFVRDYVYQGSKIIYSLVCDVLASGKTTIGNSYEYVLRAAADYNGDIQDTLYPVTGEMSQYVETISNPWTTFSQKPGSDYELLDVLNGTFVIGILSKKGGCKYYAMNGLDFLNFSSWLLGEDFVKDTIGPWGLTFSSNARLMCDPLQYISSVIWIPFNWTGTSAVTEIVVGYASTTAPYSGRPVVFTGTYDIKDTGGVIIWPQGLTTIHFAPQAHPQSASRGNYLNGSNYSKCEIYLPPFGVYDIDTLLVQNYNYIGVNGYLDLASGHFELELVGQTGTAGNHSYFPILRQSTQLGVTLPMAQIIAAGFSPQTLVAPMASAAMGNLPTSAMMLAGAIGTMIERQIPQARSTGQRGDFSSLRGDFKAVWTWRYVADEDNTHRGRPLCEVRQLSTLSGYQLIGDPDVRTNLTADEDRQINQYLSTGFYYE